MKNDIHDLGLVLDSRVKLILIESWDEPKVMETLTGLAVRRGLGLYAWSVTEGVQRLGFGGEPLGGESRDPVAALRLIKHDQQANLYVLCDLHPFLATARPWCACSRKSPWPKAIIDRPWCWCPMR